MRKRNLKNIFKTSLKRLAPKIVQFGEFIERYEHKITYDNHELSDFIPDTKYETQEPSLHILKCEAKNGEVAFYMHGEVVDMHTLHLFDPERLADIGLPETVDVFDILCATNMPVEMELLNFNNIKGYNNKIVDLLLKCGYDLIAPTYSGEALELRKKLGLNVERVDWGEDMRRSTHILCTQGNVPNYKDLNLNLNDEFTKAFRKHAESEIEKTKENDKNGK